MVERSQNVAIRMETETVEDAEDRPMEVVEDESVEEVSDELGDKVKVKEDPKYASVVTSSMGMLSPLKEDQTVQYQIIDHKATQVSQSHFSLTAPLVKILLFSVQLIPMVSSTLSWDLLLHRPQTELLWTSLRHHMPLSFLKQLLLLPVVNCSL